MDEYPPGVRAPGEGYTGPIADPAEAMRAALTSKDVLAQAAKFAADPDAPIKAYLSAMQAWKNPAKDAGHPRLEVMPVSARVPSQAERDADAIRTGMERARAAGTGEGTKVVQVVLPLPVPPPAGRMTDAVPPASQPGMVEEVARAGRRLRHVGGQIGRGDLSGAAGHLLLGRPFPEAVDDSALAAVRAERPGDTRGAVPPMHEWQEPPPGFTPVPDGSLDRPDAGGFTPAPALPHAEPGSSVDGDSQKPHIVNIWGDGAPTIIDQGHQGKHVPDSKNYDPARGALTADPQRLLDTHSGKGQPVGEVPRGQPGFRERFDTQGEIIGTYRNPQTGEGSPTTRGIIHHSKKGAHIVPARPNPVPGGGN